MASSRCDELSIPIRLRQSGRKQDNNFSDSDEKLYKWYRPDIIQEDGGHLSAATVGPVFSPPADISCNRSRFCLHPTDVLYRQSPGPSRLAFGIIQTTIGLVSGYTFPFKINSGQGEKLVNVQLIVEHIPEECMYPHSEIKVLVDGTQVGDPKPKSLRSGLREELRLKFRVIHVPRPDFTFDEVAYERTDVTFRGFVGAVINDPRLIKEILGTLVRKATTKRKLSDRVRRSIRHSMPH